MRVIDADALKSKVEAMVEHRVQESDYEYGRNQILDYVADILIEDAPTIDAVEVVRCKDCQYHEWCIPKQGRSEDDYCSRGKRREE